MFRNSFARLAGLAVVLVMASAFVAACSKAPSYRFEAVNPNVIVGKAIALEIRLVDNDGKPIDITRVKVGATRLDMGPDGMAEMTTTLTGASSATPDLAASFFATAAPRRTKA